jgi:outer membrane protein, multidrug efflux system
VPDWRGFITDPRLRRVVEASLENNRDLRLAALRIEQARAQHRIEQSALLPEIGGTASSTRSRTPSGNGGSATTATQYRVELGLSGFELDFFGRVRNLSESSLQSFFAVQENQRSARISLVAEVASAWLALAADSERLQLARSTLQSQRASYELTRRTHELGGTSGLVLAQAQTTVDAARVDVARYTAQVAQDRNALELLAGAALPDEWLPANPAAADASAAATLLVEVPAGLPSDVLLRRPDVIAAEHRLQAAEADIGAARAAFFPRISLTAAAGTQSSGLSGLFSGGSGAWRFVPQIDLPIFDAGARRANLGISQVQRGIEVATYEKTVQTAFREVADALALRGTLAEQLSAQQSVVQGTQRSFDLSQALFKNGASSYLDVLDAQRALYAARQAAINLKQAEQLNRVTLYRALGGG